jgi:hypothetical protein
MAKICGIGRIPCTQCRQEHESRAPMPVRVPSGGPGGLVAISGGPGGLVAISGGPGGLVAI